MTDSDLPVPGRRAESVRAIEAILMVTTDPAPAQLLAQLVELPVDTVRQLCRELAEAYEQTGHGFQLVEVAGGWRFQTHPDLAPYVERFAMDGQSTRLSSAALETLAIVAYKQPISRAQVSAIRGVNVDAVLRTLEQRGYVTEVGRDSGPGQAVLFGTTPFFLERVGLNSPDELPALGDFVPAAEVVEALEQTLKVEVEVEVDPATDTEPDTEPDASNTATASNTVPADDTAGTDAPAEDPASPVGDAREPEPSEPDNDAGEDNDGTADASVVPDDELPPADEDDVVIDLRDPPPRPPPAGPASGEERELAVPGRVRAAGGGPEREAMVHSRRRSPGRAAERQESVQQPGRERDGAEVDLTGEADNGASAVVVDLRDAAHGSVASTDAAVDRQQPVGDSHEETLETQAEVIALHDRHSGSVVDDA